MKDKKTLTQSEFQVMHGLWSLPGQCGYTGDLLQFYEEPQPAYTTVATFLKILTSKGFVKSKKKNGQIFFTPPMSRKDYAKVALAETKNDFFDGSYIDMMKYFIKSEQLTDEEKNELIEFIRNA